MHTANPHAYTADLTHDHHWWRSDDNHAHEALFAVVQHLDDAQEHRRTSNLHHLRMYSNRLALGLSGNDYSVSDSGDKIKLNVIKSVIDSAVAHISTNRPRPMYLTAGGTYSERKRAKNLGKFTAGQFYATQHYRKSQMVFRDACIFGTGVLKVFEQGGVIQSERVFPDEILVDDNDSKYGESQTQQLFQHKEMSRDVLAESWPEHREAIFGSERIREGQSTNDGIVNPVSVIEGWHLPSGPDADDGRHVVAVSGATLVDEPWELDRFPFAFFRWSDAPLGFFGIGLAEELGSIQVEINYLCQKIQRLMTLATSMVWIQKGTGVGKISNKDWAQREYKGQPPIFQPTPSVSSEYFSHLGYLEQKAYQIAGVSQLAAQSEKPQGLNSGEALRVYNDIGSRRFQHVGQAWERFHLDSAELMIDRAREVEERGDGDIAVLTQHDNDVEEIRFSEVSIEKDKYVTKTFPTSLMPDTPAGKVEMVKELSQVNPELAPYVTGLLTGIPDLESVTSMVTAPIEIARRMVDNILEHGQFEPPYPTMNLQAALDIGMKSLLRAHMDKVPEDREESLRRWIEQVQDMIALAETPPPMPPEPGAADPMASMQPGGVAGIPEPGPGGPMPLTSPLLSQ